MKKRLIYILSFLTFKSCSSKEDKVKQIIDDSYFGINGLTKMREIIKQKEDIFSLPVPYTKVEKFVEVNKTSEYEIARYIYKTNDGVFRMFYLIDMTAKRVIEKSSNYEDFFEPIASEFLGNNMSDFEGNNLIELMSY